MDLALNNLLINQEAGLTKQGVDFAGNNENRRSINKQDQFGNAENVVDPCRSQRGSGFPEGGNELPQEAAKSQRFQMFLEESLNTEEPISENIASFVESKSDETDNEAMFINPFIAFVGFENNENEQLVASLKGISAENVNSVGEGLNLQNQMIKNSAQITLNQNLRAEQQLIEQEIVSMGYLETQTSEILDESSQNQVTFSEDTLSEFSLPFEQKQERMLKAHDLNEKFMLMNNDEAKNTDSQYFSNVALKSNTDSMSETEQSIDSLAKINGLMVKPEALAKDFSPSQDISAKYVAIESFNDEITDQINLMVNTHENSAKINVVPPELGQIEINIHQHNDKTHISFITNIEQTKDIISMNIESLKIQLEQSGLLMGDVWVGHQKDQGEGQNHKSPNNLRYTNDSDMNMKETHYRISSMTSNLDLYA